MNEEQIDELKSQFNSMSDRESVAHQLKHWVDGIPLHNTVRDECCPDFSCCNGGNIMSVELRKRFEEAANNDDRSVQTQIMGMALSGLITYLTSDTGVKVHIAGEDPTEN